jgi:hypothetical protein
MIAQGTAIRMENRWHSNHVIGVFNADGTA